VGGFRPVAPRGEPSAEVPSLPVVWRVGSAGLIAAMTGVTLGMVAAVGAVAWVVLWAGADRTAGALVAVGGVATAVLLGRVGVRPRLEATVDGVLVHNPWSAVEIPWGDIRAATPGFDGIVIARRGAPPVVVWAVQKSNLSTWRGLRTRADVVAATLEELALRHRPDGVPVVPVEPPSALLDPQPRDASAHPLPFPWGMTRVEGAIVGELRHSSSPFGSGAVAAVFLLLGLSCFGSLAEELWDNHVLQERGVIVRATVLDVPGQVKVTWPAISPRAAIVGPGHPSAPYVVGQVVDVQSDPQEPTLARLVGVKPDAGERAGVVGAGLGGLLLGTAYAKWSRWLLVTRRARPAPGRHRR